MNDKQKWSRGRDEVGFPFANGVTESREMSYPRDTDVLNQGLGLGRRVGHALDALMGKRFPVGELDNDDEVGSNEHGILNISMPHSVSPESRLQENGEDEILPDAPPSNGQEEKEGTGVKLEDMFGDDDDEYPASSAPDNNKIEASSPPAVPE